MVAAPSPNRVTTVCGLADLNAGQSEVEPRQLVVKIAFDPVGRDRDASIAWGLEDGDAESLLGEPRDPCLHPFIDVDRFRGSICPRSRRTCTREPWMRPNRKERPPLVVFSDHPAVVAMKPPQLAVAGRPLDEVLVTARRRQGQNALELRVVGLPTHR